MNDGLYESTLLVSNKSKLFVLATCIVFGIFGIHRFYVGKTGTGVLYFFTCGLFFIGWIIDIVKIVKNKFTDKDGRVVILMCL